MTFRAESTCTYILDNAPHQGVLRTPEPCSRQRSPDREAVTIYKDVLNEIGFLRGNAGKREANRFVNTPAMRKWLGQEAEIHQLHSVRRDRAALPN